ncbi:MAG: hypothetical protein C4336_06725, partial [Armatimonadota bacterium]
MILEVFGDGRRGERCANAHERRIIRCRNDHHRTAHAGVAEFALDALAQWNATHNARVSFDARRWPELHDVIANDVAGSDPTYDVMYMAGWVPEFARYLAPLGDRIPADLRSDVPPSAFNATTWNGHIYGIPFTLSLLILFYNKEHFEQ